MQIPAPVVTLNGGNTVAKKNAVANYDKEMAEYAEVAAAMEESAAGGQWFGLAGGNLKFNDALLPNNQMAVIVVAHILENVYYDGPYDASNPQGPACFAFGDVDKDLVPHDKASHPQAPQCEGCENNEWGSADTGKGKACRNTRRLAMIPAGNLDANGAFEQFDDLEHFKNAGVGYMKLPVTSVAGWAGIVTQIKGTIRRPPFGVFMKVKVVPTENQFAVQFEALGEVPNELWPILVERHKEAKATIDFPYTPMEDEKDPPKKPAKKKGKKGKY